MRKMRAVIFVSREIIRGKLNMLSQTGCNIFNIAACRLCACCNIKNIAVILFLQAVQRIIPDNLEIC